MEIFEQGSTRFRPHILLSKLDTQVIHPVIESTDIKVKGRELKTFQNKKAPKCFKSTKYNDRFVLKVLPKINHLYFKHIEFSIS
mmetsp:Transcript_17917/g.25094  ORF Transcript_17917/g.25094 Transcript_17917/m.25094 type:complete len:84 (-) Transcript_17917:275-526(-)